MTDKTYNLEPELETLRLANIRNDAYDTGNRGRMKQPGGWKNALTGLNTSKDKRTAHMVEYFPLLEVDAEQLYAADDVANRVVSLIPDMGTSSWINLTVSDEEGGQEMSEKILAEMKRLKIKEIFNEAWRWGRLYGGAGVLVMGNDRAKPEEPMNLDALIKIDKLQVFSRYELSANTINRNLMSDNFLKPNLYMITPRLGSIGEEGILNVHHSRIIRFDGSDLPRTLFQRNNYWGDSVLTKLYDTLRNFNLVHSSLYAVVNDFRLGILKIKNLADLISTDPDALRKRVEIMDLTRSVMSSIILDADGEDYQTSESSLSGMDALIDKVNDRLVIATGLPHTIVLGNGSTASMGSEGTEKQQLAQIVLTEQETYLKPKLDNIIEAIMLQKKGPTNGKVLESLQYTFNPIFVKTDKELIEERNMQSQTDSTYITDGVLDSEEVRESRFGGAEYKLETTLKEVDSNQGKMDNEEHFHLLNGEVTSGELDPDGMSVSRDILTHIHKLSNGTYTEEAIYITGGQHIHRLGASATTNAITQEQAEEYRHALGSYNVPGGQKNVNTYKGN